MLAYLAQTYYKYDTIPKPNFFGNTIIKFTALMSMHIMIEPQIYNAFKQIQFILDHPKNFSLIAVPLGTAIISLFILILNEFIMATSTIYEDGDSINIV